MHAPLFHPAMKNVAPIRRELGLKTFFNVLGPLINPASPKNQITGVFSLEVLRWYKYIFQQTDKNYSIVHSLDGYDEVLLTGDFKITSNYGDELFAPSDLGFKKYNPSDLYGGESVEEAARIFVNILEGNGTLAQNDAVIVNSGFALKTIHPEKSFEQCFNDSRESLLEMKAYNVLKKLLS